MLRTTHPHAVDGRVEIDGHVAACLLRNRSSRRAARRMHLLILATNATVAAAAVGRACAAALADTHSTHHQHAAPLPPFRTWNAHARPAATSAWNCTPLYTAHLGAAPCCAAACCCADLDSLAAVGGVPAGWCPFAAPGSACSRSSSEATAPTDKLSLLPLLLVSPPLLLPSTPLPSPLPPAAATVGNRSSGSKLVTSCGGGAALPCRCCPQASASSSKAPSRAPLLQGVRLAPGLRIAALCLPSNARERSGGASAGVMMRPRCKGTPPTPPPRRCHHSRPHISARCLPDTIAAAGCSSSHTPDNQCLDTCAGQHKPGRLSAGRCAHCWGLREQLLINMRQPPAAFLFAARNIAQHRLGGPLLGAGLR